MTASDFSRSRRTQATPWTLIFAAWLIAAASTLAVLYFGEVMHLPICVLCWYQRICMFPLALILAIGLFPLDRTVLRYAIPLAAIGASIAGFHLLVTAGIIPEAIQPCTQGVPCSQTVIEWFGFVTIPLLSLFAFSSIFALLVAAHLRNSRQTP